MNSFLDSETLREREREGDPKRAPRSKFKVRQKLGPNLALRDGQGFRIRLLFSAGAKGAESGVKGRQIRRPFHSDYDLLRRILKLILRVGGHYMTTSDVVGSRSCLDSAVLTKDALLVS
jgi:hypothetical protein